ncbi:MAG: ABC transporter permease [candidate division NC10 bacterium]|nr:ABC transporter permease [candidate division NC10 bacterium]
MTWRLFRVWQRNRDSHRKYFWASLVGNLGEPLLYLFAFGYGLGSYIGRIHGQSYLEYIAPGLLVSTAMFAASFECTYGSFARMVHQKTYEAILATPLSLEEIVFGDIAWGTTKALLNSLSMLLLLGFLGLLVHPSALLLPVALLSIGLLFSALAILATAIAKNYEFFNYYFTLLISPMFFFSGIFFPLDAFPPWVKTVSLFLPMTYAVDLARALVAGIWSPRLLVDLLALLTPALFAGLLAARLIRRRLIP